MCAKSLTDIAAEQGRDFEEVVEQIERDKEYAKSKGVDLSEVWTTIAQPAAPETEQENQA
jgi:capsid protein